MDASFPSSWQWPWSSAVLCRLHVQGACASKNLLSVLQVISGLHLVQLHVVLCVGMLEFMSRVACRLDFESSWGRNSGYLEDTGE